MISFFLKSQKNNEVGRLWYDTAAGIRESIGSLDEFKELLSERHNAGYNREERLNEFYVLNGHYFLDACGNCGLVRGIPEDIAHEVIPAVLSKEEFYALIQERTSKEPMISCLMSGVTLATSNIFCPHCGQGWTIDNCYDVVGYHNTAVLSLADFVGRTLGVVKSAYASKTDAVYRTQYDVIIRNDRFIDLSLQYPGTDSEWKKGILVNERGWVDEKRLAEECGAADDYMIREGDEGYFNIWKHYHGKCNCEHLAAKQEKEFREIFVKAGFRINKITQLPNQYCQCERCAPWFDIETEFGIIRIGWRKRVINIEWSKLSPKKSLLKLFKKEDVTKWKDGIHAWGAEKAEEYLACIYKHLS